MLKSNFTTLLSLILILYVGDVLGQKLGFHQILESSPDEITVFCIPNNSGNIELLEEDQVKIKYSTSSWLFISATPRWIDLRKKEGQLDDFYFEYAPPVALDDTSRLIHSVNQVHSGLAPLEAPYTGDGVIIGIVDQGLDWQHPDFQFSNGDTRVLKYWDHSNNGPNTPMAYGYGQLWDSTDINNGTCTSLEESTAHGTSVAGIALGNGNANGTNKGMAPAASIIVVESNFSLPNWTLTIADAIDFIFNEAELLGMPAVVNLSLGTYLGSHDGNDPASEAIEMLLDESPGRIVVSAAGNSGAQGSYHHQNSPNVMDTNFVWFENNPSGTLGANTIFFDLWSDTSEMHWKYAIGADSPAPTYDFKGRTEFSDPSASIGITKYDTLWSGSNRLATFEVYTEIVNGNFHMQFYATNVDSVDYLYRFETTGTGKYDLWSGEWIGFNDMVTAPPTPLEMPAISNYIIPDSNQTIVSSWNCSEKVISVGNIRNRNSFTDLNATTTFGTFQSGELSPNSSKGPNRHHVIKPDVIAIGDWSLGAGPLWLLQNAAYNSLIDSGGWHVRNGGTSMASPVVSGIAALYLERCKKASYDKFKEDLQSSSFSDQFTGAVPNNFCGVGKINALALLQEQLIPAQPSISWIGNSSLTSTPSDFYQWYLDGSVLNGETNQIHIGISPFGSYEVEITNMDGCSSLSNPYLASVGLNEKKLEPLIVAPNPSHSTIQILSNLLLNEAFAIDCTGRCSQLQAIGANEFDVSNLARGIYSLVVNTNAGKKQTKIVIN